MRKVNYLTITNLNEREMHLADCLKMREVQVRSWPIELKFSAYTKNILGKSHRLDESYGVIEYTFLNDACDWGKVDVRKGRF